MITAIVKGPSKNLLLQLVNGSREPVLVVDTGREPWRVTFFNPALQRRTALTPAEPAMRTSSGSAGW